MTKRLHVLPRTQSSIAFSRSRQWLKSKTGVPSGIPTGFNHPAQRWRAAATLGQRPNKFIYPERVESNHRSTDPTPSELLIRRSISQGSSFLATLGWMMESLQDSENARHRLDDSNPLGLVSFRFDSSTGVTAPLQQRAE
jgi:hypothetical protein